MSRNERRAASRRVQKAAHGPGAATPAAFYAAGVSHMQAGRLIEAQVCGQRALAIEPDHPDTQYLMGLLALEAAQNDHAVEWFVRAIGQLPKVEYVSSLGTALQRLGRIEEASKAFAKAVQLKPDDAELWVKRGGALAELGRCTVDFPACAEA